jgi:hypothetical protein
VNSITQPMTSARTLRGAPTVATAGVLLGVCAGLLQLFLGSTIPEWTGNKMDPAGLGLTTIVLSLVAGAALWQLRRPLPRWARVACAVVGVACAGVCFSTVGRLWYLPGTLLIAATLLAVVTAPPAAEALSTPVTSDRLETEEKKAPTPRSIGAWLLYPASVILGLAVAVGCLLTVLIGCGPSSVAIAAAVLLAGGLALCAAVAPGLRRRLPAMLAGGAGGGLMAGGIWLAFVSLFIALS